MTQVSKEFGQLVRLVREFSQMGRGEFADKLGRPLSYIAGLETGRRIVALEDLENIAKALGLPSAMDNLKRDWKLALAGLVAQETD